MAWLLATASACQAQLFADAAWKEGPVPPPPAFDTTRLIAIDAPRGSTLRFGVDPATLSVGADGVVRYVVVASSDSGALNALHEGIRCASGEFRVYARFHRDGGWTASTDAGWQSLFANMPSRHPLALARAGLCMNSAPNGPVERIVRDLRAPADRKFDAAAHR